MSSEKKVLELSRPSHVVSVLVFLFFFCVYLSIQFSGMQFSSTDDPAYHVAHSYEYVSGQKIDFPIFSTLNDRPVDMYVGYHWFESLFMRLFPEGGPRSKLAGAKVYHSFLAALFFLAFFLVLHALIRYGKPSLTESYVTRFAIGASAFLFLASTIFAYRMYLYRPHVVSVTLVFLVFYYALRGKKMPIFLLSAAAPFFYSFSFMVLIPTFLYAFGRALYFKVKLISRESFTPFLVSLGGLIVGILVRPDSFNYLYNAYYVNLRLMFNLLARIVPEAGELHYATWNPKDFILILLFIIIFFSYYVRVKEFRSVHRAISFERFYALLVAYFFVLIYIPIQRTAEYAIPFVGIFVLWVIGGSVLPWLKSITQASVSQEKIVRDPVVARFFDVVREIVRMVIESRLLKVLSIVFFVGYFLVTALYLSLFLRSQPPFDQYRDVAAFMERNSAEDDIVFLPRFDMYPRLVFFNSKNRYTSGFGNTFLYTYNKEMFWLAEHIGEGGLICPQKRCSPEISFEARTVLTNVFNARYVFVDKTLMGKHRADFEALLAAESGFKKVFTDERFPEIEVYEVQ